MRSAPRSEDRPRWRKSLASGLRLVVARDDVRAQIVWYVLVGAGAFLADFLVFVGLLAIGAPVLPALVSGFVMGTLVNYLLSRALAFTGGRFRRRDEILRLVAVALIGLGLTALLVMALMAIGLSAIAAKLVATAIAFFWNYLGRRLFVFHAEMPIASWRLSRQAVKWVRAGDAGRTSHD